MGMLKYVGLGVIGSLAIAGSALANDANTGETRMQSAPIASENQPITRDSQSFTEVLMSLGGTRNAVTGETISNAELLNLSSSWQSFTVLNNNQLQQLFVQTNCGERCIGILVNSTAVPAPGALLLFGLGLGVVGYGRRRRG